MPDFVFCACQPGAEHMLKREVARVRPGLRPAFGRPGLVTFKAPAPVALDGLPELVFARVVGRSLGPAAATAEVAAAARSVGARRLHVWHRAGDPATAEERAAVADGGCFLDGDRAATGETVLDVVIGDPGEPWWLGTHLHRRGRSPFPGGLYPVEVPADAPSRAYRKLEEALLWSRARPRPGEIAVEIGSAPGGASHALLRRGLEVVGIDPGEMADAVATHPRFRHIRQPIGAVRRDQLPARVDWLLLDVNLAPQVALQALRRIVPMVRERLRGALLTLKMNDPAFVDQIPAFLSRLAEMGLSELRATQLPANRIEICVHGRGRARSAAPPRSGSGL